jgi:hypothetical protein
MPADAVATKGDRDGAAGSSHVAAPQNCTDSVSPNRLRIAARHLPVLFSPL